MRQYGYVPLFLKVAGYSLLPYSLKQKVTEKRKKKILKYARENSPYLKELYKDVLEDAPLSAYPITTKQMVMSNLDRYFTDPQIKVEDIERFTSDTQNIRKLLYNKYAVAMTSGSTGFPAIFLFDKTCQDLSTILLHLRQTYFRFPLAALNIDKIFCLSNTMMYQAMDQAPMFRKVLMTVDAQQPIDDMIEKLNKFQPKILTGFPGSVVLLAEAQLQGKLHIKPWIVTTSGEYLSPLVRRTIEKAFKCRVRTSYACTEGGTMAFECKDHHMHINEDWVILEPVDANDQPVPPGTVSDKVLLTSLYDYTQPKIRYVVTDRVCLHTERCSCGKKGLWLDVEGRLSDVLYFDTPSGKVGLAPMVLPGDDIPGLSNNQVVVHPNNRIEVRMEFLPDADPKDVWAEYKSQMEVFLKEHKIPQFTLELSDMLPQREARSGKFRMAYNVED